MIGRDFDLDFAIQSPPSAGRRDFDFTFATQPPPVTGNRDLDLTFALRVLAEPSFLDLDLNFGVDIDTDRSISLLKVGYNLMPVRSLRKFQGVLVDPVNGDDV